MISNIYPRNLERFEEMEKNEINSVMNDFRSRSEIYVELY